MRLIDVDVFAAELKERHEYIMQDPEVSKRMKWCEAVHYGATTAIIEKMPTIEATPVVRGHMEKIEPCRIAVDRQCCSCGTPMGREDNYCPNCGAKMDGGASDG